MLNSRVLASYILTPAVNGFIQAILINRSLDQCFSAWTICTRFAFRKLVKMLILSLSHPDSDSVSLGEEGSRKKLIFKNKVPR